MKNALAITVALFLSVPAFMPWVPPWHTMKKMSMAAFAIVCSASAFSQQMMTLPEIVSFMSTNDYRRNFTMTSNLDVVTMSATGVLDRSTSKLLKASILLDHSENMADQISFDCATNLCREIETELAGLTAWQRIGALNVFANAMIDDGHPEVAFVAATNLLNVFQGNQCTEVDTNVWNVLFKPGGLDVMPPAGFINADAAMLLFKMNPNAELSSYTNGLPVEIIHEILE